MLRCGDVESRKAERLSWQPEKRRRQQRLSVCQLSIFQHLLSWQGQRGESVLENVYLAMQAAFLLPFFFGEGWEHLGKNS